MSGEQESFEKVTASDAGVQALMEQCLHHGMFHSVTDTRNHQDDDSFSSYRKLQKDPIRPFSLDKKCQVVIIKDGNTSHYYSREGLIRTILSRIDVKYGGRCSLSDLQASIGLVDKKLGELSYSTIIHFLPLSITVLGKDDWITNRYWDTLNSQIQERIEEKGKLEILSLAKEYSLPVDVLLDKLSIAHTQWIRDSTILVSNTYIQKLKNKVIETFQSLTKPLLIMEALSSNEWKDEVDDVDLVLKWLNDECRSGMLKGEIIAPTSTTAVYMPQCYKAHKISLALDFLNDNGFISHERAVQHGLTLSKIQDLLKVENTLLNEILIVDKNVMHALQMAIESDSEIVHLDDYLPSELIQPDILTKFWNRLPNHANLQLVSTVGKGMIISSELVKDISSMISSSLIPLFAKEQAIEISNRHNDSQNNIFDGEITTNRKSRVRRRKQVSRQGSNAIIRGNLLMVPLEQVAVKILETHPALWEREEMDQASLKQQDWEEEEDSGNLLIEFCKTVFFTNEFRLECQNAIEIEVQLLESEKASRTTTIREQAIQSRSVESEFENIFYELGYLIQARVKFLSFYKTKFNATYFEQMENELLQSSCAELTKRMTQYVMYRQNDEEEIFSFEKEPSERKEMNLLPPFCDPVDVVSSNRNVYLSCLPPREPLTVLRESLLDKKGVSLARQWILCGGTTYRGGVKASESGDEYLRPGSVDGFVEFVSLLNNSKGLGSFLYCSHNTCIFLLILT